MIALLACSAAAGALGLAVGEFRVRVARGERDVALGAHAYEEQRRIIAEEEIRLLRYRIPLPFGVGPGTLWDGAGASALPGAPIANTFGDDLALARRAAAAQERADEDAMTGGAGFP